MYYTNLNNPLHLHLHALVHPPTLLSASLWLLSSKVGVSAENKLLKYVRRQHENDCKKNSK